MGISALISWPNGFDYPLFRLNLPTLLHHVDEVIICFTQHGTVSIEPWLRENISNVTFCLPDEKYHGDWRNKATNAMIDRSQHDWVLSLEQDFFIHNTDHFFLTIKNAMPKHDIIGYQETNRFHPAFLLMRKETLLRTGREFSVMGDGLDHFAHITKQLKNYQHTTLDFLGLKEGKDWHHMRGLTDNYFAPRPYFNLPQLQEYNQTCMEVCKLLPCSEYWREEMKRIQEEFI